MTTCTQTLMGLSHQKISCACKKMKETGSKLFKNLSIIFVAIFFVGCAHQPQLPKQSHLLEKELLSMNADISEAEANKLSKEMTAFSLKLKQQYDLVSPPLFHNFLVNIGVKKRGLCWQFAYDMLKHVKTLHLQSFDYYIGGANINDYWQEHNTLVVTCKGCRFEDGVLLDPWRNSGILYFSKLKNDKNYSWKQRGGLRN